MTYYHAQDSALTIQACIDAALNEFAAEHVQAGTSVHFLALSQSEDPADPSKDWNWRDPNYSYPQVRVNAQVHFDQLGS